MTTVTKHYDAVKYKTPTGNQLSCKGWIQEAALRMLLNNLDPEVAERPDDLIVYGGRGKAARTLGRGSGAFAGKPVVGQRRGDDAQGIGTLAWLMALFVVNR